MFAVPVGKVHNALSLAEWHVKKILILRGRKWKTSAQEHERYQTIQHRARAKSIGKRSKNTPSNLSSCLFTGSSSGNLRSLPYIYTYIQSQYVCIYIYIYLYLYLYLYLNYIYVYIYIYIMQENYAAVVWMLKTCSWSLQTSRNAT